MMERSQFMMAVGPNRQADARSFQFGLTSPPIAPQTVQTMRGPKDGTTTSSAKASRHVR